MKTYFSLYLCLIVAALGISLSYSNTCNEWLYELATTGPSYDLRWKTHPLKEDHIGDFASVQIASKEGSKIVEGTIISRARAGFWLIDRKSGEVKMIHYQDEPPPRVLTASSHPFRWESVTFPEEIFKTIKKYKEPYALITEKWNFDYVLFGKLSQELDEFGNQIIILRDSNGLTHKIDPDLVKIDLHVSEKGEGIEKLFPEANKKHILKLSSQKIKLKDLEEWFVKNRTHFRTREFYESFSQLSQDEIKTLLAQLYNGYLKEDVIAEFEKKLGAKNLALLLDPGIACRIPELIKFAESKVFSSVWHLREAFENKLGNTTLFRAMYLDDTTLNKVVTMGIDAPGFNIEGYPRQYISLLFKPGIFNGPPLEFAPSYVREIYQMRIANQKNPIYRMTSSYSHYADLAESITVQSNETLIPKGLNLYLFEVKLPELSTIRLEGPFDFKLLPNVDDKFTHICVGEKCYNLYTDRNIEVFVPFHTDASSIVSYKKIEKEPLKFKLKEEAQIKK
jgi:hypothetical protein